jgi:O-antigen ligase
MVWLAPVLVALAFAVSPATTRQRLISLVHPQADVDSNEHRLVTFETGWQMVKAHPLFGLGPEEIARNFESYVPATVPRPLPVGFYGHLHNMYLQYAAERGLPGLLFLLLLIAMALWDFSAAIRGAGPAKSQHRFALHGAIAVTIGILVGGMFEYSLGDSEVLMMFVTVVALGYAAAVNVNVRPTRTLS